MTLAQHIVFRLRDGRVITPIAAQRGQAIARIFELARRAPLLAIQLVDSHWHLLLAGDQRRALQLARIVEGSLSRVLGLPLPFAPAYAEPIQTQTHLYRAFHYVLRQQAHHGLDNDPYLEASNLGDLLGARITGAFTATHVRRLLPRIKRSDLLAHAGRSTLQPVGIEPALHDVLAEATFAAAGLGSGRGGRARLSAIAAASTLAGRQLTAHDLARLFDVSPSTIQRARRLRDVSTALVRAIGIQLALRGPPVVTACEAR